ncbi:uncharacterized protein E0L32_003629 [Thyridium curvatum]|uniref:Nucleoporin Nup159/Nup146 N-terminal domain-containing protein n=1 Tax=Thyridium curvatum TaxID=1093900 RepID=A0A507BJ53_9PEZI|nr:uncharacterized protein E0L32_003629 [Thyridium curvatum]TPX16688.1 hypothetical protein E0L32_003629 [Thyridium curvatum]
MAFSFGNSGAAMTGSAGGAGGLVEGEPLELIQTEVGFGRFLADVIVFLELIDDQGLGFLSLAGDAKVQLTSKWTDLPAPTASLISIASRKGLVAAAGPDAVHVATTESVRKAFESPKEGDSEVRQLQPQVKLPLPMRLSQVAFSADEQYLILSAETGGGLAVYNVDSLSGGSTQPAFELSTNGETLRALAPNPMPKTSDLCAIVTNNGNLLMVHLGERKESALKSQVSCVTWSNKGTQIVAGMADGTVVQMKPDGQEQGQIPKPPQLGDYHVASITWLTNTVWLLVHNPTNSEGKSAYHIATKQQDGSFVFQSLQDPVDPYGDKTPHHSILRLRDFPPNLQDLLIVSSTAVENIGLITKSKTPLTSSAPAEKVAGVFTTTELADDSKRAQVPMAEDYSETFPIGAALDLSAKDKVYKPIPTDEIDESPGPLPGLWVLNNEGVLASWWIVYNESIREGTTYPGLAAVQDSAASQPTSASTPVAPTAFGSAASPQTGAFGAKAAASPFGSAPFGTGAGTSSPAPAFGSNSLGSAPAASGPKFGAPSFGAPSFGTPSMGAKPAAPAFGQSSVMGMGGQKTSPWGSGSPSTATPAFGQPSFGSSGAAPANPFASASSSSPSGGGGGFAGFANKGGFGSLGSSTTGSSVFGPGKPAGSFGSSTSMDAQTSFPPPASKPDAKPAFGSTPFVLGTTFKADKASAEDNEPQKPSGGSMFGSGFLSLGETAKTPDAVESKDEDMDATTPVATEPSKPKSIFESTTPTTTPAPSKFFGGATTTTSQASSGGIFGNQSKPQGSGSIFGTQTKPSASGSIFGQPKQNPFASTASIFGSPKPAESEQSSSATETPKIKVEESSQEPLPPDTTSKATYPLGESSSSSAASGISPNVFAKTPVKAVAEPPLPPDPTPVQRKAPEAPVPANKPLPSVEDVPLPADSAPKATTSKPEPARFPPDFTSKPLAKTGPESVPINPFFAAANADAEQIPSSPEEELSEEGEVDEDDEEQSFDEEEEEEVSEGDEEEGEEEGGESEAGTEGSGVDVAQDLSPTTTTDFGTTPGFTPQSSFAGVSGSLFSNASQANKPQSNRLFGEVSQNAPVFQPPVTSPRSPSPVRAPGQFAGRLSARLPEASRSVSAPHMASNILGARPAPSASVSRLGRATPVEDVNVQEQRRIQKKQTEEARNLIDDDYELLEDELAQPIEPTLQLAEFVYKLGDTPQSGPSIADQAEAVYRDVNRMIQCLAVNARHLKEFIAAHNGQVEDHKSPKDVNDLESEEGWILCDIADCQDIIDKQLTKQLEDARVKDVDDMLDSCQELAKELARLRVKENDVKKVVTARADPSLLAATRSQPLSAEQAAQQNDLRRGFTAFAKLLAEAEQSLTMLKTKIVAAGGGKTGAAAPTVDAVMRTITKMTSMVEKRSGDIDVLEAQMRKLGLHGGSREGTPLSTPQKRASVFSPALTSSVGSVGGGGRAGTPSRKKVTMYNEEEKRAIREKFAKRDGVKNRLRAALQQAGPNVWTMDDE